MAKTQTRDTIADVVFAFKGLTDKGLLSDDNGWSIRRIYYFLIKYRAYLLRQKMQTIGRLSQFNYQTIPCILLDEVDQASDCPCAPASGCVWGKTRIAIPQTIGPIKSVTNILGTETYTYADWGKLKYKLNSRIESANKKPYYTIKNTGEGTYLYLHTTDLKAISITAMFDNPLAVQLLPDCDGDCSSSSCSYYPEMDFILDPDLVSPMLGLALDQLLRAKTPATDVYNNNNDDLVNNQQSIK